MNFFLYLHLCTNFFSWHLPLHEFFFGFFPTPTITFLMVRPLGQNLLLAQNLQIIEANARETPSATQATH